MIVYSSQEEVDERKKAILSTLCMTESEMDEAAGNYEMGPHERDLYREYNILDGFGATE